MWLKTVCPTTSVKHQEINTMANLFQRIFLPRYQLTVLDTIEQNVGKIRYEYRQAGDYKYYIFTIEKSDPYLILCSVLEQPVKNPITTTSYYFEQRATDGKVIQTKDEGENKFANLVHSKMFNAFIEQHGCGALYKKQARQR